MNCYEEVAQNCMFAKLRHVSRHVTNIYAQELKKVGLTPVQYSMMTAIKILENPNINTLSAGLNMDRTTINRNLKPLIREDIVYIGEKEDKREKTVDLTTKGEEIYECAYTQWKISQGKLEEKIGKDTWNKMNSVLDDVIQKIH